MQIGQYFLASVQAFGIAKVYLFFAFILVLGAVFTYKYIPETKGKSLEQIESELGLDSS